MLLPDPRSEVIVRRVLGDRECALWYPGNAEALAYNQGIRALLHTVPTTRQGAVSEGDVERGGKRFARPGGGGGATAMEASRVSGDQALVADEFSRASTYSQPRTVTLDSKFQGAPQITVWTGYAVLVVSRTGRRRVEVGPATVLLDYDEGLEALCLSTGQPKSAERVIVTPYLRIDNNQVSDSVGIETRDHVQVELRLAYRVDFEGDPLRWFAVENYVQLLCDRVRSLLKGQLRRHPIEELYAGASDRIRDLVLGAPGDGGVRPGLAFPANGMRIADVDVLEVVVADDRIRALLEDAQHDVVRAHVDLSNLTRELAVTRQREALSRETAEVKQATRIRHYELARELAASELATALARIASSLRESDERKKLVDAEHAIDGMKLQARLDRVARERDQELAFFAREQAQQIELMRAQAETAVQRFTAASGNFSEALLALGRNETLVKVAEAWSVQRLVEGESLGDTLSRLFHNTPLKPLVDKLVLANGT
jgi:major vault protein